MTGDLIRVIIADDHAVVRAGLRAVLSSAKGLDAKVLVLTMQAEEDYLVPLMEAGAAGYLVKSAADRELVDAVRAVAHGDVYVRPAAARVLAKNLTKKDPAVVERERFEKLTQRERDVMRYV